MNVTVIMNAPYIEPRKMCMLPGHPDYLSNFLEAVSRLHGQVIVIPERRDARHTIVSCQTITYRALSQYIEDGTTVIIG